MLDALYSIPFFVLELPKLKLKKPSWVAVPSPMIVFAFILLSYFLVTGGKWFGLGLTKVNRDYRLYLPNKQTDAILS